MDKFRGYVYIYIYIHIISVTVQYQVYSGIMIIMWYSIKMLPISLKASYQGVTT